MTLIPILLRNLAPPNSKPSANPCRPTLTLGGQRRGHATPSPAGCHTPPHPAAVDASPWENQSPADPIDLAPGDPNLSSGDSISGNLSPGDSISGELPEGWEAATDELGRTYYFRRVGLGHTQQRVHQYVAREGTSAQVSVSKHVSHPRCCSGWGRRGRQTPQGIYLTERRPSDQRDHTSVLTLLLVACTILAIESKP